MYRPETLQKVAALKESFSVEGALLVKSDRFTDDEIEEMMRKSTCHPSHWHHIVKGRKTWTDDEIAQQIEVFLDTPAIDEQAFKDAAWRILRGLPFKNKDADHVEYRKAVCGLLGWTEERNGLSDMWSPFGSARITDMEKIFDGGLDAKFHLFWYVTRKELNAFSERWSSENKMREHMSNNVVSPVQSYYDLLMMANNVAKAAHAFYCDRTKDIDERVRAFTKYGKRFDSILYPSDPALNKVFHAMIEIISEDLGRREIVTCERIVDMWIGMLKSNRCKLSYSNPHHPKVEKSKRNYRPSDEAMLRLRTYYMENLFAHGVSSFLFDW